MYDSFDRAINYLRISLTDKCNLRCRYCMPAEGIKRMSHFEILSFEEITTFTKMAVEHGINKVRLTGGEPLVRKGVIELTGMIAAIPGVEDLSMTTNGILLKQQAQKLAEAGLNRVNVSLDTLDPEEYRHITRGGNIDDVLQGIDAAQEAGLYPVKLNCVIRKNRFETNAQQVAEFAARKGVQVRFIREMNLENGFFSVVEGGNGGACHKCNRIRLTANGLIKPCLFHDFGYDIRELGMERALEKAVDNKPKSGTTNTTSTFYNMGG